MVRYKVNVVLSYTCFILLWNAYILLTKNNFSHYYVRWVHLWFGVLGCLSPSIGFKEKLCPNRYCFLPVVLSQHLILMNIFSHVLCRNISYLTEKRAQHRGVFYFLTWTTHVFHCPSLISIKFYILKRPPCKTIRRETPVDWTGVAQNTVPQLIGASATAEGGAAI